MHSAVTARENSLLFIEIAATYNQLYSMRSNINQQISIAKHIVDGSITLDSTDEFKSILRIFPSDPALHRVFADHLVHKKSIEAAIGAYSKAATLNIESGMMLQAIICKIQEWRLKKPNRQKAERFYRALSGGRYHQTPLNVFFNSLSFDEFSELLNQMTRVRVAAGKTVRKLGDQEKDLYLIVSGTLKATKILPLAKMQDKPQKTAVYLTENDFFGNIYPFENENISQAFVETIANAELVKIPREKFKKICKKYPNIELGLIDLFKARSEAGEEGLLRQVRLTGRHKLPIKIEMKIYPGNSGSHPIILDGYTRDVSIGGMCIVLDAKYAHVPSMYQDIRNAGIQISMESDAMTVSVTGKIVWSKEVAVGAEKTVALGIQYMNLTPKLSGLLVVFADILHAAG
jgi:CRP-like cAMP-binding protein